MITWERWVSLRWWPNSSHCADGSYPALAAQVELGPFGSALRRFLSCGLAGLKPSSFGPLCQPPVLWGILRYFPALRTTWILTTRLTPATSSGRLFAPRGVRS